MTEIEASFGRFLFIGLPYSCLTLFIAATVHRFRMHHGSLSPHPPDERPFVWAVVPFHYGILGAFVLHLVAAVFPSLLLSWNSDPFRLLFLELTAFVLGFAAMTGLCVGVFRRLAAPRRLRVETGGLDWLVLVLFLLQILSGILASVFHPWGYSWLAAAGAPYLRSLALLHPEASFLEKAPWLLQFHTLNGFLLIGVLPYTRLLDRLLLQIFFLWRNPLPLGWKGGGRR